MNDEEQRELYLLLRHEPDTGANRGREFYDGCCQSCDSPVYETHTDKCPLARLLVAIGGPEEAERQSRLREHRDADLREKEERLARHRKGIAAPGMDAMNLALKRAYGDFKIEGEE